MMVFQLKTYDPNAGQIDHGLFKTRALAIRQRKHLEDSLGRKFERNEYEYETLKVVDYISKTIHRPRTHKES